MPLAGATGAVGAAGAAALAAGVELGAGVLACPLLAVLVLLGGADAFPCVAAWALAAKLGPPVLALPVAPSVWLGAAGGMGRADVGGMAEVTR